jgi:hypothetical protein
MALDTKEKRRAVWSSLTAFIRNRHGMVTSPPDVSPLRFEITPGSSLAEELRRLGYKVLGAGTTERLTPFTETISEHGRPKDQKVTRNHVGFAQVEIYDLDLPVIR